MMMLNDDVAFEDGDTESGNRYASQDEFFDCDEVEELECSAGQNRPSVPSPAQGKSQGTIDGYQQTVLSQTSHGEFPWCDANLPRTFATQIAYAKCVPVVRLWDSLVASTVTLRTPL